MLHVLLTAHGSSQCHLLVSLPRVIIWIIRTNDCVSWWGNEHTIKSSTLYS